MTEKEIQNIRKRKSYREMGANLRWLETGPSAIEILKKMYNDSRLNYRVYNPESLEQLERDHKQEQDDKRQT